MLTIFCPNFGSLAAVLFHNNGGGIYNAGNLTVNTNSIISYNTADSGAGIYNFTGATAVIEDNTSINNNSATTDGGGIYNLGTLTLDTVDISANSANDGGAIYNSTTGILTI